MREQKGELVCTAPFPSMPIGFWNDADGAQVPRGLLRALPERLAPRRLRRAHGARRRRDLRPLRRRAESRRRAHRHRRDLPHRRAVRGDRRERRRRPGLGRRHARRAVRALAARRTRSTRRSSAACATRSRAARARGTCRRRSSRVADIPRTMNGKIVELAVREAIHGRPRRESRRARESGGARLTSATAPELTNVTGPLATLSPARSSAASSRPIAAQARADRSARSASTDDLQRAAPRARLARQARASSRGKQAARRCAASISGAASAAARPS